MEQKIITPETEMLHQRAVTMAKKFQQSEADMILFTVNRIRFRHKNCTSALTILTRGSIFYSV